MSLTILTPTEEQIAKSTLSIAVGDYGIKRVNEINAAHRAGEIDSVQRQTLLAEVRAKQMTDEVPADLLAATERRLRKMVLTAEFGWIEPDSVGDYESELGED
jgi:Holliday junction resolvase-like predicted endonuclease